MQLPRSLTALLLDHRVRSLRAFPGNVVFAPRSGRPLGQRNVLRELRRAQTAARTPGGQPTDASSLNSPTVSKPTT